MLSMYRSTFWRAVSAGMLPQPVRIGGLSAETVVQVGPRRAGASQKRMAGRGGFQEARRIRFRLGRISREGRFALQRESPPNGARRCGLLNVASQHTASIE